MCEGRLLRYGREIAQVWEDADVAAQGLMYGCQQPHVQPHVWDVMCSLMYVSKHKASCMGGCCSTRPQVWEHAAVAARGLLTHIHNKKQVNKLNQKLHNTQPKVCKS